MDMESAAARTPAPEREGYAGKVVAVFNPNARAARAGEITRETLEAALRARDLDCAVVACDSEDDAVATAERAARDNAAVVVAVGGDGTVHGMACGLLRAGRTQTALGILPFGTMNN